MHSTTRLSNQMVCGLLLVANAIGGAALSVPSTTENAQSLVINGTQDQKYLEKRLDYEWGFRLYNAGDGCDINAEYRFVYGNGNFGCSNIDFDFTWNSFQVVKGDARDIVLFRGKDCPYTEDDPFHYDCNTNICNIGYGEEVPSSYLVTARGQGTCNN